MQGFRRSPTRGHEDQTGEDVSVRGEVVDMVCYIDHNATGSEHLDCAKTCIKMGLPVGIKADDGKTYLLIGETQANQL